MHLIQVLLPLRDNEGAVFPQNLLSEVLQELSDRFGGSTAYTRSPAEGVWQSEGAKHHDDIIVVEVMVDAIDRDWWKAFRKALEGRFRQKELVVRVQAIELM
jgi:hypothetical protein